VGWEGEGKERGREKVREGRGRGREGRGWRREGDGIGSAPPTTKSWIRHWGWAPCSAPL
jgi:hypothetical protein